MSRMLLAAVAVAAVLAVGVNALHEDEVGNRDWYQANIGDITHASFHPSSPSLKQVYVASKQGVVAAIPTAASSNGEIRWRHILSVKDKAECIVAHGDEMAHVVTTRGQVLMVAPGNGQILASTSLKLSEYSFDNQLRVFGCAKGEAKNTVVVFASVATGDADTEIVRVVIGDDGKRIGSKAVTTLTGATTAIKSAAFSPNGANAWVITEDSQLLFALSFSADKFAVAKLSTKASDIASVTDSNTAIVRVPTADGKKVFKAITSTGADDKTITVPACSSKHCKYVLESGFVVGVSRASESSLDITTKGASVSVANTGNWAPTILASTSVASSGKVILLLKGCNSDIQLVTITDGRGEIAWSRLEGMASPAFVRIADQETIAGHEVRLRTKEERFGFHQRVFMLSKFGTIYTFQTGPTAVPAVLVDVEGEVASALGMACVRFQLTFRRMTVESGIVAVVAYHEPTSSAVTVIVDASTGVIRKSETKVTKNAAMFYGPLIVDDSNQVHYHNLEKHWPHVGVHAVDMRQSKTGILSGVTVGKDGQAAQTWRMRFGQRVVGHASGAQSPLNIMSAENLRVYTNTSKAVSVNEVRRKYPTANVLVVAHVETSRTTPPVKTLVITALDIVSGSVLNVVRHKDAQGPIHIVIAEHAVIYHFYNTHSQRFMIGVWEMFEREDSLITDANMASPAQVISSIIVPSKIRTVSSASLRPPVVPTQVLLFPPGAITSLGVTNSYHGIARKQLVATTTAGNVYTVDLRTVLFGGQVNPQKPDAPPHSFVAVSPLNIISFGQPVMGATQVITSPTTLESSSHVVVVGIDTFYMRVSSGKAWDLLNDDFNAPLLVVTLVAFAVLTFVARYFANKKGLSVAWA